MSVRPIPEGSTEIQTGLFAHLHSFTVSGTTYSFYDLYSSEGYCFWSVNQPENYDEDGDLLPLEQRVFAQYACTSYTTIEALNENFISVPVQEGYEIVSISKPEETA